MAQKTPKEIAQMFKGQGFDADEARAYMETRGVAPQVVEAIIFEMRENPEAAEEPPAAPPEVNKDVEESGTPEMLKDANASGRLDEAEIPLKAKDVKLTSGLSGNANNQSTSTITKAQSWIVRGTAVLLALSVLFPPWNSPSWGESRDGYSSSGGSSFEGWAFIAAGKGNFAFGVLFAEWMAIIAVGTAFYLTSRGKPS